MITNRKREIKRNTLTWLKSGEACSGGTKFWKSS